MQVIKLLFAVGAVSLLVGCANQSEHSYVQKSGTSTPLSMPAGVNLKSAQNYYPLPAQPDYHAKQPSLVPPGSHLEKFEKKGQQPKTSAHLSTAKWSENKNGQPILTLMEKPAAAWAHVGKALQSSDYQVLDQDPSMSSYYILDSKVTANQITEKTPIYRVYVKTDSSDLSEVTLVSENNQAVDTKVAKRILTSLQQHLA